MWTTCQIRYLTFTGKGSFWVSGSCGFLDAAPREKLLWHCFHIRKFSREFTRKSDTFCRLSIAMRLHIPAPGGAFPNPAQVTVPATPSSHHFFHWKQKSPVAVVTELATPMWSHILITHLFFMSLHFKRWVKLGAVGVWRAGMLKKNSLPQNWQAVNRIAKKWATAVGILWKITETLGKKALERTVALEPNMHPKLRQWDKHMTNICWHPHPCKPHPHPCKPTPILILFLSYIAAKCVQHCSNNYV